MSKNRRNDRTAGQNDNRTGGEFDDHFDSAFGASDEEGFDLHLDEEELDGGPHEDDAPSHRYDEFDDDTGLPIDDDEFDDAEFAADELLDQTAIPVGESQIRSGVRSARTRSRRRAKNRSKKQSPLVFFGGIMMLAGFALAITAVVAPYRIGPALTNLNTMGLTPGLMITLGAVLALVSQLSAALWRFQDRMAEFAETSRQHEEFASATLEYLAESQEHQEQSAPTRGSSDEEINQVLHTLARQDEKINNLTKALKMYGKPLVEVSRQVAEVAARAKSTTSEIGNVSKGMQAGLESATQKIIDDLASLLAEVPSEVQGSFTSLNAQLSSELTELKDTLAKANDADDSEELAGLRTDMSALQEAVRGLTTAVRATPAAVAPVAAAPVTATPAPATAAPAASTTAPAASLADAAPAGTPGPGELANSISGATKSEGKNVLGAIAKLKKMRP